MGPLQLSNDHPLSFALRADGRTYRNILRRDPCAYCGRKPSWPPVHRKKRQKNGTVDHIVPKSQVNGNEHLFGWTNLTAACYACNNKKRDLSLLEFLLTRKPLTDKISV